MQQFADRVGGLAGEQFDVVHTDPARHVQFLGQIRAELGGDGEPLPDRAAGWHRGQAVPGEDALHVRVGIQGGDELDLGRPMGGGGAAYADGKALVVGGAEHHPAGHAKELADLIGGQPSPQVHVRQDVGFDGEPVFPVEPSSGSQLDAVGAEPVLDRPGRDLGQLRDLSAGEPVAQVQVGQERARDARSGAAGKAPPAAAPGFDGHPGPVEYAGDPLPAYAYDSRDAVGGQALAPVQVDNPLRQQRPRNIFRAVRASVGPVRRGWDRITARVRAAAR